MKRLVQKLTMLQKSMMAVGAMAMVTAGFMLMSFNKVAEVSAVQQTVEEQGLYWYFHEGGGNYSYIGQSVTPPTSQSCQEPITDEETCMKGLNTNPSAADVDNSTPAVEEISRQPLN